MTRFLLLVGAVLGLVTSAMYMLEPYLETLYIFTPSELHQLSQEALALHGNDTASVVAHIASSLAATHPAHVNPDEEWIFNNAGGAMGAMYILHASVTEYLIVFGTAVGTEGHTGRHTADDYFHILKGEQLAYAPGKGVYEPEVYGQGEVHHLRRGEVKQYKMEGDCFALEYARGWIPPMLFFGYADSESLGSNMCLGVRLLMVVFSLLQYAGFPDVVAHDGGNREGDGGESADGQVVSGDFACLGDMERKDRADYSSQYNVVELSLACSRISGRRCAVCSPVVSLPSQASSGGPGALLRIRSTRLVELDRLCTGGLDT